MTVEKIDMIEGSLSSCNGILKENEWMNEWINERMDEWMNEWMNEWISTYAFFWLLAD